MLIKCHNCVEDHNDEVALHLFGINFYVVEFTALSCNQLSLLAMCVLYNTFLCYTKYILTVAAARQVWYFRRLNVPSHMPGFVLTAKSVNQNMAVISLFFLVYFTV